MVLIWRVHIFCLESHVSCVSMAFLIVSTAVNSLFLHYFFMLNFAQLCKYCLQKDFMPQILKLCCFGITIFFNSILPFFQQTAVLLLRIDDIVSGSKKGSEEGGRGGGGGGGPMMG